MIVFLLRSLYIGGALGTMYVVHRYNSPRGPLELALAFLTVALWPLLWLTLALWMVLTDLRS